MDYFPLMQQFYSESPAQQAMPLVYALVVLVILLTRLPYLRADQPRSRRATAYAVGLQVLALLLLLQQRAALYILALVIIAANIAGDRWEHRTPDQPYLPRLLVLLTTLLALMVAYSPLVGLGAGTLVTGARWHADGAYGIPVFALLLPTARVLWMLAGAVAVIGEAYTFVRCVLQASQVRPQPAADATPSDRSENNAGRLIGVLERLIIYILLLAGQYAAIGFILAAKGLARFKELDQRAFAEYFLVGTLLSALAAMGVALTVRAIVG